MPSDEEVVEVAAEAAEEAVFEEHSPSDVSDLDVTVAFEDGELTVDVYLDAASNELDEQAVVDDAIAAAVDAVDRLFAQE